MRPSSRKNIEPILRDVRPPRLIQSNRREFSLPMDWQRAREPLIFESRFGVFKKALGIAVLAIVVVVGIYGSYLWSFKDDAEMSAKRIYTNFRDAAYHLIHLETESADSSLSAVGAELDSLSGKVSLLALLPVFQEIPEAFSMTQQLTETLKALSKNVSKLKRDGVSLFMDGEGDRLLTIAREIRAQLVQLDELATSLRNTLVSFDALPPNADEYYITLSAELDRSLERIDTIVQFLERPGARRIILAFENPSEMRPAGGFIGSYGYLTLARGGMESIEVNDIYYPDHFLSLKVVPPKQLQGMTPNWGARDANWFFDFPTSAEKILSLLEASSVYRDKGVTFDGVLALNVRVIEDVLEIVGPIELPGYDLVLTNENFLKEVQYEVEAGRDKKPGQNPKKILTFITPLLFEKLGALNDYQKILLLDRLTYRLKNKDIKFYFRDDAPERLVRELGAAGEVFSFPDDFVGDYLAVVNANVAGGKSDVFVEETIRLESYITADGVIVNALTVARSHHGQDEKESWYRAPNQNFIKVFAPPDSQLTSLEGNTVKAITPLVDYKNSGYTLDAELAALESTRDFMPEFVASVYKEFGKAVFGMWFTVPAGETKELQIGYNAGGTVPIKPGTVYQFVFEKQSGVDAPIDYTLHAPPGYRWHETQSPTFHYAGAEDPAPPSRIIVIVTLERDK